MSDIPFGYCQCGCGEKTGIGRFNRPETGQVKGQPVRFRRGHQARRSAAEQERAFWDAVDKDAPNGCWVWTGRRGGKLGYGRLKRNGVSYQAHRYSWTLTNGEIPDGLFVCHHCDNPPCVNPAHLFLGTQADNLADRDAKGRAVYWRGPKNAATKLTEEQVQEIRRLSQIHIETSQIELARRFDVSPSLISQIIGGKAWGYV
jgi:hypothetical protein